MTEPEDAVTLTPQPSTAAIQPTVDSPPSPHTVDPQIIAALRGEERSYVLKLGELMESLISSERQHIALLTDTPDQCLLVHRCSAYYHLIPQVDHRSETIYVHSTSESRIPLLKISELVPAETLNIHSHLSLPTPKPQLITGTQVVIAGSLPPPSASSPSKAKSRAGSTLESNRFIRGDEDLKPVEFKHFPGSKGVGSSKLNEEYTQHDEEALLKVPHALYNPQKPFTRAMDSEPSVTEIPSKVDSMLQDSEALLRGQFKEMKLMYHFDEPWPSNEVFFLLLDITEGSTDLASLIGCYLQDPLVGDPEFQLNRLLYIFDKATTANIQEALPLHDLLYLDILYRIPLNVYAVVKRILVSQGLLTGPIRSQSLAVTCNTLSITRSEAYEGLRFLHPVMYIPSPQDIAHKNITVHSDSFLNFLTDPSRSGDYAIIEEKDNAHAAENSGMASQTPSDPSATVSSTTYAVESSFAGRTAAVAPLEGDAAGHEQTNYVKRLEPRISNVVNSRMTGVNLGVGQSYKPGELCRKMGTLFSPGSSSTGTQGLLNWKSILSMAQQAFLQGELAEREQSGLELEVLETLAATLSTREKREALLAVKSDHAQVIIDFMCSSLSLSRYPESAPPWFRRRILITLLQLCERSGLHPWWTALNDVDIGSQVAGDDYYDFWKGYWSDGQRLCLKVVRLYQKSDGNKTLQLFAREAIIWGQLSHPNIDSFYGIYYFDSARIRVCLVSPWQDNRNIVAYLRNNPQAPRKQLCYDLASGLNYLHSQSIIHGDLKGVNVLVTSNGRACITGFSCSTIESIETETRVPGSGVTIRWASPELIEGDDPPPAYANDIWAFGCVCFEILTGLLPFHDCTWDTQIIRKLLQGRLPARLDEEITFSNPVNHGRVDEAMKVLIEKCWSLEPKDRPSGAQVLESLEQQRLAESCSTEQSSLINEQQRSSDTRDHQRFQNAMAQRSGAHANLLVVQAALKACGPPDSVTDGEGNG